MSKPPAFQFYAQDFLTGVMYLTNEEIGIYIKMLAKQWTDGKIPKKRLGFLVGIEWNSFSDELKNKFVEYGDFLVNTRLEKERDKKDAFLKKQKENGKKGGRPPKNIKPKDNPTVKPNETQIKPLEEEDEDIVIYNKKQFLKDWNELRKEYLNKPSFLNTLNGEDLDNFNDIIKYHKQDDFKLALIGLFKQKKLPNDNKVMQSNPKHFLTYFNSYLTAYHDKNNSLYGKQQIEKL